jgi:hypothetical protein
MEEYKIKLEIFEKELGKTINKTLFEWRNIEDAESKGEAFISKISPSLFHNTSSKPNYPFYKLIHNPFKNLQN